MAVTSMTVSAEHLYHYWHNKVGTGFYFYEDMITNHIGSDHVISTNWSKDTQPTWLLAALPDLRTALGSKILYRIEPTVRQSQASGFNSVYTTPYFEARPLKSALPGLGDNKYVRAPEPDNLPLPAKSGDVNYVSTPGADCTLTYSNTYPARQLSYAARLMLSTKTCIFGYPYRSDYYQVNLWTTLLNGNPPSFTIYYDSSERPATKISTIFGPTDGYKNPRKLIPVHFSLSIADDSNYLSLVVPAPASEVLYWRETGDDSWQTISFADTSGWLRVPSNTFPAESEIEWYLSVTDEGGHSSTSEVFTFSTTDGTSKANPTAPKDSVENGANPILFSWTVSNETAEPPSRVKAIWAVTEDAETWTTLFDESSAIYSYEAPAGTFPGGNIYWKVTSYNADGVEGLTSDPAVFQCIAPPDPPVGIHGDLAPYTTISWQAETQTAFAIEIDGVQVVKQFGTGVYSYKLTDPLQDGEHEVSIRVQGAYGYWSNPGTAVIQVANGGTGSVDLTGVFDVDALLQWTCSNEQAGKLYHIYRDGVQIAQTAKEYFVDRMVLGEHSYSVVAELSGGHLCRSNDISGTMKSCVSRISPLNGSEWIELQLSENSSSIQSFSWTKNATLRHYAGAVYPVAELSPFEDRVASYDCAFATVQEARALEALRGKLVILKSRGGEVTVGALIQLNKTAGDFYLAYQFSIQQIHWEDMIYDSDS